MYETVTGRISSLELQPAALVFSRELDPRPGYVIAQNIYSVLLGIMLLLVVTPVLAAAAIIAKCGSNGPVLGREPYIRLRGVPIPPADLSAASRSGT